MNAVQVHKFIQEMRAGKSSMENPLHVRTELVWHHSRQLCRLEEK
jgi:hypothetical protein